MATVGSAARQASDEPKLCAVRWAAGHSAAATAQRRRSKVSRKLPATLLVGQAQGGGVIERHRVYGRRSRASTGAAAEDPAVGGVVIDEQYLQAAHSAWLDGGGRLFVDPQR